MASEKESALATDPTGGATVLAPLNSLCQSSRWSGPPTLVFLWAGSVAGEFDEVELSPGLSLGGCFGTDPARDAKKPCLERSSSIVSICSLPGSDDLADTAPTPAPLMRTSSLPTETEEERWRGHEMQSLKRLEQRNSMNSGRSGSGRDDGQEPLYPSGFQLRRSVASQGSTSSSMTKQGGGGRQLPRVPHPCKRWPQRGEAQTTSPASSSASWIKRINRGRATNDKAS